MGNNGSLAAVNVGRFIAGIGIGETVVVGPVYLSEIAPAQIRGLCTCIFTGFVYIGIMVAYFANWGTQVTLEDNLSRWVSDISRSGVPTIHRRKVGHVPVAGSAHTYSHLSAVY
jgi:MFS family permease